MTNQAAVQTSGSEEPEEESKGTKRGKRRNRAEGGGQPSLDMDELRQVVELIDSHGFTEFEIEREGYRLRLRRELTPQIIREAPAPSARSASGDAGLATSPGPAGSGESGTQAATATATAEESLYIITSPIVGTFYRAASPESSPFVGIGSRVTPDSIVCIVEAMKLMNEIQAEITGEIIEILVENGQPVEYGQPLFGVRI